MIVIALWVLATLDGAFTGYRAAAGRNALIRKRAYYRRAMLTGALVAQLAVAVAALVVLLWLAFARDRESLLLDYQHAGLQMLRIFLPYAAIILLAFVIRAIPSVDIRSITSTTIFGPFTLIRPFVAIIGLVYGVLSAPRLEVIVTGAVVLIMMLSLESALSLIRRSGSPKTT